MTTTAQISDAARIPVLVLAGNSTFTLVSKKTGTRFTFRVRQCEDEQDGARKELWFVSTMTGPDNESAFTYTGIITRAVSGLYQFRRTAKSKISDMAPSYKAINWFLASALAPIAQRTATNSALAQVEFWHEGTCCRCGRKLTVPESIASGLGPECAGKSGGGAFRTEPVALATGTQSEVVMLASHRKAVKRTFAKAKVTHDQPFNDSLDGLFGEEDR